MTDILETLQEASQSTREPDAEMVALGREVCEAIFGAATVDAVMYAYRRSQQEQRASIKLAWDAEPAAKRR